MELNCIIRLHAETSLEYIASQMQKSTSTILCVLDGCTVLHYESLKDIPKDLLFETKYINKKEKLAEYHYRSTSTDSLYVFFLDHTHNHLKTIEEIRCEGSIIAINREGRNTNIKITEIILK